MDFDIASEDIMSWDGYNTPEALSLWLTIPLDYILNSRDRAFP